MTSSSPPPAIPGYKPLRPLGGGKYFEVWEARPTDDVVPVAVKFPRPEFADEPNALTLLRREARAGMGVRHPRLGRVIAAHVFTEPRFVVLQLVPGESLRDSIDRRGCLDVRSAVWAARQTAEGLAALHKAGFVHADVKPANVRVTPTGEATLIDLAFAHRPGENRGLVDSGFVMGTAHYLAPELCRRPPTEGQAADVFALGVTLFESLTGELPYPATSAEDAIRKRRTSRPRDLADEPGNWPDRVVDVVRAMLAVDPGERPSAARVVWDLVRAEIDVMGRAG